MVQSNLKQKVFDTIDYSTLFDAVMLQNEILTGSDLKLKAIVFKKNPFDYDKLKNTVHYLSKSWIDELIIENLIHIKLCYIKIEDFMSIYNCKKNLDTFLVNKYDQNVKNVFYGYLSNSQKVSDDMPATLYDYIEDLFFLKSFYNPAITELLYIISKTAEEKFVHQFLLNLVDLLDTLGTQHVEMVTQTEYIKIINICLKNVAKVDSVLYSSLQKRIRVKLFNIGTNPNKRFVVNFCKSLEKDSFFMKYHSNPNGDLTRQDEFFHPEFYQRRQRLCNS